MRPIFVFSLLCLPLAACGDREAACVASAWAPVRTLDSQIAETDAALIRGYRISDPGIRAGLSVCTGGNISVCAGSSGPVGQRQIPIDRRAEVQRLANLQAERIRAAQIAEAQARGCRA